MKELLAHSHVSTQRVRLRRLLSMLKMMRIPTGPLLEATVIGDRLRFTVSMFGHRNALWKRFALAFRDQRSSRVKVYLDFSKKPMKKLRLPI